jgi:hypothetical protein
MQLILSFLADLVFALLVLGLIYSFKTLCIDKLE